MSTNRSSLPRGLRNHNPLNIVKNSNTTWFGEVGNDGTFVTFADNRYGYRAAFKILRSYQRVHKINKLNEIIERWCPRTDKRNNTDVYIRFVANYLRVPEDYAFDFSKPECADVCNLTHKMAPLFQASSCVQNCNLVLAMAIQECGIEYRDHIKWTEIIQGYKLAVGSIPSDFEPQE